MRYILKPLLIIFCLNFSLCFGAEDWTETNCQFTTIDEKVTDNIAYKNSHLDLLVQKNKLSKEDAKEPLHNTIKVFEINYTAQKDGKLEDITQRGLLKTLDPVLKEEIILQKADLKIRYNPKNPNEIEFSSNGKIYLTPPLSIVQSLKLQQPPMPTTPSSPTNNENSSTNN